MQVGQVFDEINKTYSLSTSVIDKRAPSFLREACLGEFFSSWIVIWIFPYSWIVITDNKIFPYSREVFFFI